MADFTPTSSIAWTQNHAFAMGMEANFTDPADTVASITQNIPFSIGELQIFGGSLTMQGNQKAAETVSCPYCLDLMRPNAKTAAKRRVA